MTKAVGEGLKLLNWFTDFFSRSEYTERVEDSLIGTADALVEALSEIELDKRTKVNKKIVHYIKQYKANRLKLKG